jgi:hypothetical protein
MNFSLASKTKIHSLFNWNAIYLCYKLSLCIGNTVPGVSISNN